MPNDRASQADSPFVDIRLTADQLARYEEQGYLRVGRTLTDKGLHAMREQVSAAWAARKQHFDSGKTWLQNSLLANVHQQCPIVRRYFFAGPMVDVAEQVIGPNIKAATSQLSFKLRGNTQSFKWHHDNAYGELDPANAISCLTALDDADEENGCLWVVPESHKQGQGEISQSAEDKAAELAIELDVDDSLAVPMTMQAGECLFFHSHMLHQSQGNHSADRDRRFLFMRYADADAVEVYNNRRPRLGRLVRGRTKFPEVEAHEAALEL